MQWSHWRVTYSVMLKEKILRYLTEKIIRPARIRDLARFLNMNRKQYGLLRSLLKELVSEGKVRHLKGQGYVATRRPPPGKRSRSVEAALPEDLKTEIEKLVTDAGLRETFPKGVEKETLTVARLSGTSEIDSRVDLRDEVIFTIDPAEAKDFDDAISIEKTGDGGWRIGVHIADVSYYVKENTRLDAEAWQRGTSVYLVDRVIPMLPHTLSSDACSLKPDCERLTFSCFIKLDREGRPLETELADTVIRSRARLTYEDAQLIIDNGSQEGGAFTREVTSALLEMAHVARLLTRNRQERGSLDFDLPEPIVVLDDQGVPVSVKKRHRLESNRLIEEFMILANEAVAEYALNLRLPFIYRIHDEPDPEKIEEFREFVQSLGYSIPSSKSISPGMLRDLLKNVEGDKAEPLICKVMLRHMKQAMYAAENTGHYGLASHAYCHFTSPIRRYPDLVVHRLLRRYHRKVPTGSSLEDLEGWMQATAEQSSERERLAAEVERDSIKLMQIAYMEKYLGEIFPGVISGVTGFGLFVELKDLMVDGLIHISDLGNDYFLFEKSHYRLIGERTRRQYRIGDQIEVQVVRADRAMRQLDFIPAPEGKKPKKDEKKSR